jgi:hypothetical protein
MNGPKLRPTVGRSALAALAVTGLTVSLAAGSAQAGLPVTCLSPITACGCVITSPGGTYLVNQNLTGSQDSICIDIAAPRTVLEIINHATLTGVAKTGVGVKVETAADHSVIAGVKKTYTPTPPGPTPPIPPVPVPGDEASITGFETGIEVDADNTVVEFFNHLNANHTGLLLNNVSNATVGNFCADFNDVGVAATETTGSRIYNFTAEQNSLDGALLNSSSGNSLSNFTTIFNLDDGVLVQGSSSNSVTTGSSQSNTNNGIRIGCANTPGFPFSCVGNSDNNHVTVTATGQLTSFQFSDNCEMKYPPHRPQQQNGIHVEVEDSGNVIAGNTANSATDNANKNLLDDNPDCDDNVWTNNVFDTIPGRLTKVEPPCAGNP